MKWIPLRIVLAFVFLCAVLCCGAAAAAADLPVGIAEPFDAFIHAAEGRYFTETEEGTAVLELIPAFGRLFASVGYYMDGGSLYSYYAAELIPVCASQPGICLADHFASSFDLTVRLFSNMSMAGNYWPGETAQRLTLTSAGLMLSHYSGTGDALITKSAVLLIRDQDLPGMFVYGPEYAEMIGNAGQMFPVPEKLQEDWQADGGEVTIQLSFGEDGMMYFLKDQGTEQPPLLLKGGFWLPEGKNGQYQLCYLMSSPSSGTMPYSGCVMMVIDDNALIVTPAPGESDTVFLPEGFESMRYERNGY